MARPKIYEFGTENISLSVPKDVLEVLKKRAKQADKPLSSFVGLILKTAVLNDIDYSKLMAKHHNRQMQYWLSEKNRIEAECIIET